MKKPPTVNSPVPFQVLDDAHGEDYTIRWYLTVDEVHGSVRISVAVYQFLQANLWE